MAISLQAQQTISGTVSDRQGNPLPGANIYLKNTFDGATADLEGHFKFNTKETGAQLLLISYISFETQEEAVELKGTALGIGIVL